jgi:2,4-dienoyl-CoA reductase-like NADH-dependent reductase (Old Yellow Enzyme family)/thioredoxin reductase
MDFSPLFEPLAIGQGDRKIVLKNRMVMAPMITRLASGQGEVTPRMVDYYVERAKGGIGTILVEAMDIQERAVFNLLGIYHDRFINELENLAMTVKEKGTTVIAQIYHIGLRGGLPGPNVLTTAEIQQTLELFSRAAERVKKAGFDGVMIHGAHGYLVSSFLSPLTNQRQDQYGGNQERRTRFAAEVVKAIREAVGKDFPIFFRMNGADFLPGGLTLEDAKVTAPLLESAGVDVVSVGSGIGVVPHDPTLGNDQSYSYMVMPMYFPRGWRVEMGAEIKSLLKIPVSISGRINDPLIVRDILVQKKADLIDLGRQMLADPYFPQKIAEGKTEDICQCIACNYCHGKRFRALKQIRCAINPLTGRESETRDVRPAPAAHRVLVVGGGIAGLQAAIGLAKRGFHVSLFEKEARLGGQLELAALPPGKGEIRSLLEFLIRQTEKSGVEVNLNSEVTPEFVLAEKPYAVIIATGARPIYPKSIPIDKNMNCLPAWDILSGDPKSLGAKTVILGGGFVAAEIADFICKKGMTKDLTIIEMREDIAMDLEPISRQNLLTKLQDYGVKMVPNFLIRQVKAGEVIGEDVGDGNTKRLGADTVIIALGTEAVNFPTGEIEKAGIKVAFIGDVREPRGIAEAMREGYIAGVSLDPS